MSLPSPCPDTPTKASALPGEHTRPRVSISASRRDQALCMMRGCAFPHATRNALRGLPEMAATARHSQGSACVAQAGAGVPNPRPEPPRTSFVASELAPPRAERFRRGAETYPRDAGAPPARQQAARARHAAPAFTLGETLFAMALVVFVLLNIVASLPSSIGALRETERRAAESRIVNALQAEISLKSFADVASMSAFQREYGAFGDAPTTTDPVRFRVTVMLPRTATGYRLPEANGKRSAVGDRQDWVQRVTVQITDKQSPNRLPRSFTITQFKQEPDFNDVAPPQ